VPIIINNSTEFEGICIFAIETLFANLLQSISKFISKSCKSLTHVRALDRLIVSPISTSRIGSSYYSVLAKTKGPWLSLINTPIPILLRVWEWTIYIAFASSRDRLDPRRDRGKLYASRLLNFDFFHSSNSLSSYLLDHEQSGSSLQSAPILWLFIIPFQILHNITLKIACWCEFKNMFAVVVLPGSIQAWILSHKGCVQDLFCRVIIK
jgi:hypothetical protein